MRADPFLNCRGTISTWARFRRIAIPETGPGAGRTPPPGFGTSADGFEATASYGLPPHDRSTRGRMCRPGRFPRRARQVRLNASRKRFRPCPLARPLLLIQFLTVFAERLVARPAEPTVRRYPSP